MKNRSEQRNIKVLLEMRPALEGFAGIPQETRLLFRGLRMIDGIELEGMIQTSHRVLARGTPIDSKRNRKLTVAKKINRYSRVVISTVEKPYRTIADIVVDYVEKRLASTALSLRTLLGLASIKLTQFESDNFQDFIWRTLFSKTLPASDYELIASANQKICSTPWHSMHMAGLATLTVLFTPRYPQLATPDTDIFISQTPYPAVVSKNTKLVVRYHDAIPVFMPHTIPDKSVHQATHFYALMNNVRSGAYFACVSEATRQDLIKLFPEAEQKSVTIHNMVSHHYFKEADTRKRVPGIIRARLHEGDPSKGVDLSPKFFSLREQENFYRRVLEKSDFRYLLIVSTVEPRKNHARLLAAWEVIKADLDPDIKLVIVGGLGWDYAGLLKSCRSWIDRGELFMLNAVPAPDLRVLYRNAEVTVCPSLGEGFDFSGVEAMRSGGVVVASDIPVHREVYENAAEYFDPYATGSLVGALKKTIYAENVEEALEDLRKNGETVSARYLPEVILPKWDRFLEQVMDAETAAQKPEFAISPASKV